MLLAASFTDINFALSFWTAVTFLLLLIVLSKVAWGPILAMVETREKTISDAIEAAKKERAEAEKASAEAKSALEKARAEMAEQVRKTQAEVAAAKGELMAQAKKESEELLAAARKTIAEEQRTAIAQLRAQTADLVVAAAARLIQAQMSPEQQKKLVEEYVKSLPNA